jgi:hypothetical protein
MTPALKAMVEAMAAELKRQASDDDGAQSFPAVGELQDGSLLGYDGIIDLEKVARAGLEAIREPSEEVSDAGGKAEPFMLPEGEKFTPGRIIANTSYRAMIDAILKETP